MPPSIAKHANNLSIAKNLTDRFPHPYTLSDAEAWIALNQHQSSKRSTDSTTEQLYAEDLHFAITRDGAAIGSIGFVPGEDVYAHTAMLGYWLGEEFWGQGIMTEAVASFSHWIFKSRPRIVRLWAAVYDGNEASMKVLEGAGYVREGVQRKGCCKNGVIGDQWIYVKFRDVE